ncbi:MAG: plasmid recombination protein [Lachnospiraceae bacterium]|nr:plasmid recombination protein [Lachnospiraceae bacterium]
MAKMAGSFSVGRVALKHDLRITQTKNVDKSLMSDNEVLENNLVEKTGEETAEELIEKTINEMMQPHIDDYNQKQTRENRKINVPYCEYWKSNKKLNKGQLCYEAVMQIGEHETNGGTYYRSTGEDRITQRELYKQIYKEGLEKFKKEFPHLKILWAVVHLDEPNGTPHLHICYCPVGENYKQGIRANVSIGNALGCDGIERLETRNDEEGFQLKRAYEKIHHEIVNPLINEYFRGIEIKEEVHGLKHQPPRTWVAGKEATQTKNLEELNEQIKEETSKLSEISLNREGLLLSIWEEIKCLFKRLKTQERRQEVLEGRAGKESRLFGRANTLKENANKELDNLMQQETVESVYLDEIPGIKRTRNATNLYEKELDRVEKKMEEDDLLPDDGRI